MKREQMTLGVQELVHAPWNPRTEAELDAGHPEMVTLIASVRAVGVIQPIAVWDRGEDAEDRLMVIAGNRRFAAAVYADKDEIPAMVFTGITEAQAREITRIENEVRLGVDALKDAELIGSMLNLGYDQKEIAAHFGVPEAKVCRRVKLLSLIPEIREIAEKSGNFTTHCLEQISLYPVEIQKECLSTVKSNANRNDKQVKWSDLSYAFNRELQDLSVAKFDTKACLSCPKRTGAQPDLWGDLEDGDKLGRCLCRECFERKVYERNEDRVRKMVGKGVEIVCVDTDTEDYGIDIESDDRFVNKRGKKHPVAWWTWKNWNDEIVVKYGPSLEDVIAEEKSEAERERKEAEARMNESEKDRAEREAKEAEAAEIRKQREEFQRKLNEAWAPIEQIGNIDNATLEKLTKKHVLSKLPKKLAEAVLPFVVNGMTSYELDRDAWRLLVTACPEFAKAVKVKPAMIKAIDAAEKDLAKFDKEHVEE